MDLDPEFVQNPPNRSYNGKKNFNAKKSVSFKTLVDIFQLSDAWQLHVKKCDLKTEEDQVRNCGILI